MAYNYYAAIWNYWIPENIKSINNNVVVSTEIRIYGYLESLQGIQEIKRLKT